MRTSSEELTRKDEETLNFIIRYIRKHHYAPTIREIQDGLCLFSTSTVNARLNSLQRKGAINMKNGQPRTIVICKAKYILDVSELKTTHK